MRIAVSLSGSIREQHKALASLRWFAGHDLSVHIHTWKNVDHIKAESWSHRDNLEPTPEVLEPFKAASVVIDDFGVKELEFKANLARWMEMNQEIPRHTTNICMHSMYYSLGRSAEPILERLADFDMIVRLRFDCQMEDDPLHAPRQPGWVIPNDFDYAGLNDQLGWLFPYPGDVERTRRETAAYLSAYNVMEEAILAGCPHGPESLLQWNFSKLVIHPLRPRFSYTVR